MKICPNCNSENDDTSKFCKNCGENLNQIVVKEEINENFNNESTATNTNNVERPKQFCKYCGAQIDAEAEICPKCGVRLKKAESEKNPAIALVLSFIFPGIGQLYNGQKSKCIKLIIIAIICLILSIIVIGAILYFILWIYGMYDAYKSAKALNNGELLEDKLFS